MKIRKSLLEMTSETYADDNAHIPVDAVDCTQGCNPYGNHPALLEIAKNAAVGMIYNYPHDQEIYEEIERFWEPFASVEKSNIILADGSMGALEKLATIFETPDASALSVAPTFTDATILYKVRGMPYRFVPLDKDKDYAMDTDAFIAEIKDNDSIIYLDNPNNPTGQVMPLADVERVVAAGLENDAAVIIDEAYGDFIPPEESAACLLDEYENLVVVRTFSKAFGMAGMRAGYIIASKLVCDSIRKVSDPYNMNEFARQMGAQALRHGDFALEHVDDFVKSKEMLRDVTGNNIKMAMTDDRIPITLLWHVDTSVDLAGALMEKGVVAVSAEEFDCLGKNAVRLRVPVLDDMEKVCQAVAALNG